MRWASRSRLDRVRIAPTVTPKSSSPVLVPISGLPKSLYKPTFFPAAVIPGWRPVRRVRAARYRHCPARSSRACRSTSSRRRHARRPRAAVGTIGAVSGGAVNPYPRTLCAATLALLSPDFAEHRAIGSDDCKSETRAIGVAHASDRLPEVRERIHLMAADSTEEGYRLGAPRLRESISGADCFIPVATNRWHPGGAIRRRPSPR